MSANTKHTSQSAAILAVYDSVHHLYRDLAVAVEALIETILKAEGISIHSVTQRIKDRSSLERKLLLGAGKYGSVADVTDLAGVRIITYFSDTVDRVAAVVAREFAIDADNSIDKRAALRPDSFGYLSLHHVVELNAERTRLAEYRRFAGLKLEVQTRSILQHAWAEIEHDLGYKATADVPRAMRRRFARLAGLLEIADDEFAAVRDGLQEYEDAVPGEILSTPTTVELDKASLRAFVANNALVKRLDEVIAFIGDASGPWMTIQTFWKAPQNTWRG